MSKRDSKFRLIAIVLSIIGLGNPAVSSADTLQFSSDNYGTNYEGVGIFDVEVTRTGSGDGIVSVDCEVSDGTATTPIDYTATTPQTLNWGDGDTTSKSCTVTIVDDNDNTEGDETVNLALTNIIGASIGSPSTATLTILDDCGPGPEWIRNCPSGTDYMQNTEATMGIGFGTACIDVDLEVTLTGPMEVYRGNPVNRITSHSVLPNVGTDDSVTDVIETEIVSMILTGSGFTLRVGDGIGNLSSDNSLYSPGAIDELPSYINPAPPSSDSTVDSTMGHSFFEIFFELEGTPWGTLHNQADKPLIMETVISKVPPLSSGFEAIYGGNVASLPILLYDASETAVACLVGHPKHTVTLVTLTDFTATKLNGAIFIEWETDMELDNAGFNIWRSEAEQGEYVKINDSLIQAEGSDYQYSFTDDAVVKGNTYYYKLEDLDLNGTATFHGPVSTKRSHKGLLPAIQFLLRDR